MKKFLIIISLIIISLASYTKGEEIVIPDEAIRFRVVAKSNSEEDQKIKMKVKDNLQVEINKLLKNSKSIDESRRLLKSNQNSFSTNVRNTLLTNKSNDIYNINYGLNYFPKKEYKGITYKEGYYESLVVTIGDGKGDNWWCVLYPNLCFLDKTCAVVSDEGKEDLKGVLTDEEYQLLTDNKELKMKWFFFGD